jgi:hypothetical protein
MIVGNLDFVRVAISPDEANPELVVDPDAELTIAIRLQGLEPVAWWYAKIVKPNRSVN